jgi:hypothetical protein
MPSGTFCPPGDFQTSQGVVDRTSALDPLRQNLKGRSEACAVGA